MARITTVDCERVIPNRFALVLLAAARARALNRGDAPRVTPDRDKPTVIALREIGAAAIDETWLDQWLQSRQRDVEEEDRLVEPTAKVALQADDSQGVASANADDTTSTASSEASLTTT
jgi:DNA-directed RNA polymerase subunit omega